MLVVHVFVCKCVFTKESAQCTRDIHSLLISHILITREVSVQIYDTVPSYMQSHPSLRMMECAQYLNTI